MRAAACPRCPHEAETPWEAYERRKAELRELDLSPAEYEQRIRELADELRV
jgi:hypothetical protein